MYAKKSRFTPLIVVILLLLVVGTTGTTVAKYIHSTQLEGKVTFTAKLAENIELQENEAVRQSDGSYILSDKLIKQNTYTLIPGLDIPKNPHIVITGKTPVKAYLFLEVYHAIGNNAITYELLDIWQPVMDGEDQLTGEHDGKVYVYTINGSPEILETSDDANFDILENNMIYVGQGLNNDPDKLDGDHLDFYACLSEIPTNDGATTDLKTIYENAYLPQS